MTHVHRLLVCLVVAAVFAAPAAGAQSPPLETVLARAATYAERYLQMVSSLVAEEHYVQQVTTSARLLRLNDTSAPQVISGQQGRRRELRSDVMLIRTGPPLDWWSYRDVFEVDRRSVRDRDDRLVRLFLEPAASASEQAVRIHWEGARFNLSNIGRTLNVPGVPLLFLQNDLRPRFQFAFDRRDGASTWILKYEERLRPTLFRHNSVEDNASTGRIWVDAERGVVSRTEHVVTPPKITVTFTTHFRPDSRYGVSLPTEMREQVTGGLASERSLEGTARYTNFKRFEVKTDVNVTTPSVGSEK